MVRTVMRHNLTLGVDAAMLAIPSGGSGLAEARYIYASTSNGIGVVTAGKSALANLFDVLRPRMKDIRYNAAVGGGVEMPSFFKTYLAQDVTRHFSATAIVNATLNFDNNIGLSFLRSFPNVSLKIEKLIYLVDFLLHVANS